MLTGDATEQPQPSFRGALDGLDASLPSNQARCEGLPGLGSGGGKKIRPSGPKAIKKSISPAPESSSPAATPLAGAGQVESDNQPLALMDYVRLSFGLDHLASWEEIKEEIDSLFSKRDRLVESNHMLEDTVARVAIALDADADMNLAQVAARCKSEQEKAIGKVAELTQEVANLNRLLAREPIRESSITIQGPRDTCESILGILGIGNGFALTGHTSEDEDLEAITAGLIRGAIADGVWRSDAPDAKELTTQDIVAKWSALPVPDGYESLTAVLQDAIDQAAHGKGLERHADARPFHDQPILRETHAVGLGFPAGQARKKILEAVHCCDDHPERAVADLLGAINYTAAMVIAIRSMMVEQVAA